MAPLTLFLFSLPACLPTPFSSSSSTHPQEACLQGNLIAICLEQLSDPHPLLRQWVAICLGRIWQNFDSARWCGVRDSAHEKLYSLLSDPIPEVRVKEYTPLGRTHIHTFGTYTHSHLWHVHTFTPLGRTHLWDVHSVAVCVSHLAD